MFIPTEPLLDLTAALQDKVGVLHYDLPAWDVVGIITSFYCQRQGTSAEKLQANTATLMALDGLARSKHDLINRLLCAHVGFYLGF